MIGFLVWNTGSSTHPVAFVYATGREQCKRELQKYLATVISPRVVRSFHPDNWIIEPVTRKQEYVTDSHVVCPDITKINQ